MTQFSIYNSLGRKKEAFEPLDPSHVRLYACGPTVLYAHIGNARMAVTFDLLVKVLRTLYPKVTYVSNITDVDDKIIMASNDTGEDITTITQKYTRIYNNDMASLGVAGPDVQPKATEYIQQMIAMIEALIAKDHAYEADAHVLFHVPSYKNYGALSGRSRDEQIAGARVEVASYKKDPADFVLWKPSKEGEPGWDSPWGYGRPGWHIECSAMSETILALPFDIHGGGADLKFPHHENEIAQSCSASGDVDDPTSFVKYWVHNGFVTVNGEKMSKSLGNITLVHDLISKHKGEVLRLTLLSGHYRQPLDWSEEKIADQKRFLDRIYKRLRQMADMEAVVSEVPEGVMEALCDDLNTPRAMAEIAALLQDDNSPALKGQLLKAGEVLGLFQEDPDAWLGYAAQSLDAKAIETLLHQRADAKAAKDFASADAIRDELTAMGVQIEDNPQGTTWRMA